MDKEYLEALKKLKENTEMFDEMAKENDHTYKEDTVIEAYVYHFNNIVIEQALIKAQENEKNNARNEEILQKHYQEGITLDSVRALKQERDNYKRVLEIIKKKCVDVGYVITLFMYQDYNSKMDELWGDKASSYYLTEEEFKLLKEVLKDE